MLSFEIFYVIGTVLVVAIFLFGIMQSNLQMRSIKFTLFFSIGATFIQWGNTLIVLWVNYRNDFLEDLSLPTTIGLFLFSFLVYFMGFNQLRNIEDHSTKSIKLLLSSTFVSTIGIIIQIALIGGLLALMDDFNPKVAILSLFSTITTFFLIFRIMQQIMLDKDELYLNKTIRFALTLGMSIMVNSCVVVIVDMFSVMPDKGYLTIGFVSTFVLILFTVIYGEKQYDFKNETLNFLAYHDQLTSLKNRIYIQSRLEEMVLEQLPFHLMFIDLDHFKQINDIHGHQMGDNVLQVIATRLSSFKEIITIARIGGDEFTVITRAEHPEQLAENFIKTLALPVIVEDNVFQVTSSIGFASYPNDGKTVEELMKKADLAMYQAKQSGRDGFRQFDQSLQEVLITETELKSDLIRALKNEEFVLHYQPLIKLSSQQVTGFEALIRWNHPTKGLIPPLSFVKMAEDSGLIVQIGKWVLYEACRQMKEWNQEFHQSYSVSVNLSLKQFGKKDIYDFVLETLNRTGLDPNLLNLEITESTIMVDPEYTISTITKLSNLGVKISIDDFGTGYSSLSYLKQFSIQSLKIDKSFIDEVTSNSQDSAIVNAILSMAKNLGLKVVAEGVEKQQQQDFLLQNNCEFAQGYLFSKPLSKEQVENYIHNGLKMIK